MDNSAQESVGPRLDGAIDAGPIDAAMLERLDGSHEVSRANDLFRKQASHFVCRFRHPRAVRSELMELKRLTFSRTTREIELFAPRVRHGYASRLGLQEYCCTCHPQNQRSAPRPSGGSIGPTLLPRVSGCRTTVLRQAAEEAAKMLPSTAPTTPKVSRSLPSAHRSAEQNVL